MKIYNKKGIVKKEIDSRSFLVDLEDGHSIIASLSAKLALYFSLSIGDKVVVNISSDTPTKGCVCRTTFHPNARLQL